MYTRIAVAVDGSKASNLALNEAIGLAATLGAKLLLIHIMDDVVLRWGEAGWVDHGSLEEALRRSGQKVIDDALAMLRRSGLEGEVALVTSHGRRIGHLIADEAARWHADVMVMGTHGWHGFSHLLLGSEAETAIRAATMPVLLVRGEE